MEYIGKRISILRKESELSIVVLSLGNKTKNIVLGIWLFLWTLCGLIVFSQFFVLTDSNSKIAIVVWMGFWAYFEYKIANAFLWRISGKEKIKLRDNKLFYKRDIAGRGKIKIFETDLIKDFRVVEAKENSFFENLNNSYWVIAGEKLTFDYYGKVIKLGIQLNEADAKALLKVMMKEMK